MKRCNRCNAIAAGLPASKNVGVLSQIKATTVWEPKIFLVFL
jgi:hypothetical protein